MLKSTPNGASTFLCPHSRGWGRVSASVRRIGLVDTLGKLQRFDRASIDWLAARRSPGRDKLFVLGSYTGVKGVPWSVLLTLVRLRAQRGERISLPRGSRLRSGPGQLLMPANDSITGTGLAKMKVRRRW